MSIHRAESTFSQPPDSNRHRVDRTLPAWITPELIELTIRTWQPFYRATLDIDDAIGILLGAASLIRILSSRK